jgi:hypothetical protein
MKQRLFYLLYLFTVVLVFFAGLELALNYLMNNPDKCPDKLKNTIKEYYRGYDTFFIQQEKEMAQYDASLFYTLKPGEFTFYNREFSTPYVVNSIGVRDDEESLNYPKIVMVGDSYGMGWGVDQDKTYASLVEQEIGIKVLNTAISSYGTPREMEILNRVKTDSMEYLIIQYCPNDYIEIAEYVRHDNKLIVSPQVIYDSICDVVRERTHYYPFKTTKELLPMLIKNDEPITIIKDVEEKINPDKKPPVNVAKGFLDAIRNAKSIPAHTKIYIFTLDGKGFSNYFLENVEKTLNKEFSSSLHDRITFLDFSQVLKQENYFVLDVHVNASANMIIADTLIKYIKQQPKGKNEKKWYYDNGSLSVKASYFNHYKEGLTSYYWPNGSLSMQTNYHKGAKEGEEIRFNENGEEIERLEYEKGILK